MLLRPVVRTVLFLHHFGHKDTSFRGNPHKIQTGIQALQVEFFPVLSCHQGNPSRKNDFPAHIDQLHLVAQYLMEKEKIDGATFDKLMKGELDYPPKPAEPEKPAEVKTEESPLDTHKDPFAE